MTTENNLFICSTQYQLFNCLNIIGGLVPERNNDLVLVVNNSKFLHQINKNELKKHFDNVYVWKVCPLNQAKWKKLLFIFKQFVAPNCECVKKHYSNVYITGTEIFSKIIAMKSWRQNGSVHYYEDGLETYDIILSNKYKIKQDAIFRKLYGKSPLEITEDVHVYEPSFVINNDYEKNIVSINFDKQYTENNGIYAVFKEKNVSFKRKVIFLSAWFNNKEMYDEQLQYVECLSKVIPQDYSVKLHPSDDSNLIKDNYETENCGNFELANARYDMSNKVYISIISTACLTPSLLFKRTPTIIFLYKIFMNKYDMPEWKETEKVILKFCEKYQGKVRVYIPETIHEYLELLARIK